MTSSDPSGPAPATVALRPLGPDDLDLMRALLRDPEMTRYLGGPESDARIRSRHRQYLADTAPGGVFTITVDDDRGGAAGVGWAGYWELDHHDRVVWEAGLSVLTAWQGHGIGSTAFRLILERASAEGRHRFMHAFPHIDNAASNRMCAGVGFELVEETDIEYSKGHWIRCNDWRYALWSEG